MLIFSQFRGVGNHFEAFSGHMGLIQPVRGPFLGLLRPIQGIWIPVLGQFRGVGPILDLSRLVRGPF